MVDQAVTRADDSFTEAIISGGGYSDGPIDVRYESTVINEQSYVTEEQFQEGVKTATTQAKANAFKDLKNRPAARAKVGMS